MGHLILLKEYGDLVLFPEIADFERVLNEFMEINSSPEIPEGRRDFEGHVLAKVIAEKIEALPPEKRQWWIIFLLGYLGQATYRAYQKVAEVETMLIPSEN